MRTLQRSDVNPLNEAATICDLCSDLCGQLVMLDLLNQDLIPSSAQKKAQKGNFLHLREGEIKKTN